MKLIALVAIAMMVNGVRTLLPAGAEVKGLSQVDIDALKLSGSIEDREEVAQDAKADVRAQAEADAAFQAAREAVQARQASIEVPVADGAAAEAKTADDAKAAAAKKR